MKNIFLLMSMLLLSYSMAYAQRDLISFNETEHNFGNVSENGGKVSCNFIVTNNSSEPLLISKVTASCGCTTPTWTKEPIEAGKTGTITVEYNPKGRPGAFSKTISVSNNQTTNPLILRIKGVVNRGNQNNDLKAPDPANNYPVKLGNFLLKDQTLDFGEVAPGKSKTIRLEVFNNAETPMVPAIGKLPKQISVKTTPENIPAHTEATMDVTFNASNINVYGNFKGDFNVIAEKNTYPFPFFALIMDDLTSLSDTEKANAGKINFSTKSIDLDKSESATLKISNSGKTILHIKNIQSSNPLVTVSKEQLSIKPEEISEVKVNIARKKMKDSVSTLITIVSDDPGNQIQRIPVKASL